MKIQGST
jgi:hypothetical protein